MSTNKTDRDNWRKFLGIKEPSATLDANRVGVDIGKTAGRAGGASSGGSIDSDDIPEGEDEQGAEKGDGAADAGEKIKVGDEFDRAEDLYDCETGEEVTIDGLGEKGSEQYPTGFEDCKEQQTYPDFEDGYYWLAEGLTYVTGSVAPEPSKSYHQTPSPARSAAVAMGGGMPPESSSAAYDVVQKFKTGVSNGAAGSYNDTHFMMRITRVSCATSFNAVCQLPPPKPQWPAVDRNHLVWNKEKGCFEPLCPELNNQVLDKYKACESERILCDKDGNKVKVTVDGDTVKVTQAKYNQTAEIKNGKVRTVKKLSESQTEAEFK